MIKNIDYCIVVMEDIKPFMELHLESLKKTVPLDSFASFNIVNKNAKDNVIDYCKQSYPSIKIHEVPPYKVQGKNGPHRSSSWQWDLAHSCNYLAENCGTAEWVFFIHPDTAWNSAKQFFENLSKMITPNVAVIWNNAFFLLRREAFKQSHIKFWPLIGVAAYHRLDGNIELDSIHTGRVGNSIGKCVQLLGIEAGMLLFVELQILGWSVLDAPIELFREMEHITQCSKHDLDMSSNKDINWYRTKLDRVNVLMANYRKSS